MGKFWIDLGNQIAVHGTSDGPPGRNDGYGSIFLSDRDIDDVYGILFGRLEGRHPTLGATADPPMVVDCRRTHQYAYLGSDILGAVASVFLPSPLRERGWGVRAIHTCVQSPGL